MKIYEQPIQLDDLKSLVVESSNNQCFICCASFEERCLSIAKALGSSEFDECFIFKTQELLGKTQANVNLILEANIAKSYVVKDISTLDPLLTVQAFFDALTALIDKYGKIDIIVDITTFTRESLLIFIRTAYKLRGSINSYKFLYNPASCMSNAWLTRGVSDFRSVLGFAGAFSLKKPIHLIVLTGFELERAIATIEEYEPFYISIGVGDENASVKPEFYAKNKAFVDDLVAIYGEKVKTFSFSLLDPEACRDSIVSHINSTADSNVVIAPMSNKISTLGAALVGLQYKDIQLCYAKPQEYNIDDYSQPDETAYLIELGF